MKPWLTALLLAWAAQASAVGDVSADFLKIPPTARSASLSGAMVCSQGLPALDLNPAGLAGADELQVALTHVSWVQGFAMEHVAGAGQVAGGVLAASFGLMGSSDIEATDSQNRTLGTFRQQDMMGGLAFSKRMAGIDSGFQGKWIRRSIAEYTIDGAALDWGAVLRLDSGFSLGGAIQNLGYVGDYRQVTDQLPYTWRIASAWRGDRAGVGMRIEAGIYQTKDVEMQGRLGIEGSVEDLFFLRAGYALAKEYEGQQQYAVGAGLKRWGTQMDYAFSPMGLLGMTHRLSLTAYLGTWSENLFGSEKLDRTLLVPMNVWVKPGQGSLNATWDPPRGIITKGYHVYLRKGSEGSLKRMTQQPLDQARLLINNLDPELSHGLAISVVNALGVEGPLSQELVVRPMAQAASKYAPPLPPRGLKVARVGRHIELDWEASPEKDVQHYSVYAKTGVKQTWEHLPFAVIKSTHWFIDEATLPPKTSALAIKALRLTDTGYVEGGLTPPAPIPQRENW
jgi:hypothetical protein